MNQKESFDIVTFKFIEAHLELNRSIRPKTISDQFRMHRGTASELLSRYCSLCPSNTSYIDKQYKKSDSFSRSYLDHDPQTFIESIIIVFGQPKIDNPRGSDNELRAVYFQTKSILDTAEQLKLSYPTTQRRLKEMGIQSKAGYKPIEIGFTGLQCRQAREHLNLTRDQFCNEADISKVVLRQFELNKSNIREKTKNKTIALFKKYHITLETSGVFTDNRK